MVSRVIVEHSHKVASSRGRFVGGIGAIIQQHVLLIQRNEIGAARHMSWTRYLISNGSMFSSSSGGCIRTISSVWDLYLSDEFFRRLVPDTSSYLFIMVTESVSGMRQISCTQHAARGLRHLSSNFPSTPEPLPPVVLAVMVVAARQRCRRATGQTIGLPILYTFHLFHSFVCYMWPVPPSLCT